MQAAWGNKAKPFGILVAPDVAVPTPQQSVKLVCAQTGSFESSLQILDLPQEYHTRRSSTTQSQKRNGLLVFPSRSRSNSAFMPKGKRQAIISWRTPRAAKE